MFGVIACANAAVAAIEQGKYLDGLFEESIQHLPEHEKCARREKRRIERIQESQHSQLCRAIKESNNNKQQGFGIGGMLFAFLLGKTID